jgi:hypothetical protein
VLLRPAIPDWVLLMKPQGTDESGCTPIISFVSRRPGVSDPLISQSGER